MAGRYNGTGGPRSFGRGSFNNNNRGNGNGYNNNYSNNRGGFGNYNENNGATGDYNTSTKNFSGNNNNKFVNQQQPGSKLRDPDFKKINLPKIQKGFYHEHAAVTRRSQSEIDQFITENEITLDGNNIPRPIFEFGESTFPEPIINLLNGNYSKPTAIQSISWPVALSGRDMISIARTGSGKTLGFMLPAIVHTTKQSPRNYNDGPTVLVILPTRELAQQVEEVAKDYCKVMNIGLTCCFGGAPKGLQANDLKRGVDICIATPGRLLDFLEAGTTNMNRCSYLVLDEADRMLDMGFEPQIRKIINQIRSDRQSLMFSATWPKEVRTLAQDFQNNPVFLNVGSMELSANHNIQQHVELIDEFAKQARLFQLLEHIMKQRDCKTMIFVETKRKADDLTRGMRRDGWPALCIHGDKNQSERDWVLNEFREGKTPILLATDVAARGLDVNDIKFVINYDYPNNSEDYVHRIGRTGRRDQLGTSYTFFTHQNGPKAKNLIKVLEEAKQHVPSELYQLANTTNSFTARGATRSNRGANSAFKRNKSNQDGGAAKRGRFDSTKNAGGYGSYSENVAGFTAASRW